MGHNWLNQADDILKGWTNGRREESRGRRRRNADRETSRERVLRKLGVKGRTRKSRSRRERKSPLQKAGEFLSSDLASGGLLVDEQQDEFIRTVIEQSTMLPVIRTVPMRSPSRRIERIAFTGRVLKPLDEFTDPGDANKPDLAKITLDTFEFGALFVITYDTLTQNLESAAPSVRGSRFETTLMEIIAERVAVDIEDFVLNSDTASADPDFTKFDGALKLASNSFDNLGLPIAKGLFKDTLLALPKKFRLNKGNMLWMYGPSTETEWRDELSDRGTALGDEAVGAGGETVDRRFGAYGIPAMQVPVMPEDLGAGSDEGKLLLTNPLNMITGIHREVFFDWDKDIRKRALEIMVTTRFGFKYEDPDGASRGEAFKVA